MSLFKNVFMESKMCNYTQLYIFIHSYQTVYQITQYLCLRGIYISSYIYRHFIIQYFHILSNGQFSSIK